MTEIQKWNHARKGLVVGRVVQEDADWLTIELSEPMAGLYPQPAGATVTVARRFMTEVTA